MKFYVSNVVYLDESGEEQTLTSTEDDPCDLGDWAYVPQDSDGIPVDGNGSVAITLYFANSQDLIYVEVQPYDWNILNRR